MLHNDLNFTIFASKTNNNNMSQVSMTVRMDSNLKASFDSLCNQFGMSSNAAVNIFARAVVQRGRIPFEIVSDQVADKTQQAIDKFWTENKWGIKEIDSILEEHLRTPYNHPEKK